VATAHHDDLTAQVDAVQTRLEGANRAREVALPLCRQVIRSSGSSIRAVHRHRADDARQHADDAERALRDAQAALSDHPGVAHAGFLHDAEKEYVEARATAALVADESLPSCDELAVDPTSWLRGIGEAASELRRHLLDRLRAGDLEHGERLLAAMDDVYDALITVDFPDALTHGLRRTVDALRAVLERTRGDVTTTVLQERLRRSL
jgi:translin